MTILVTGAHGFVGRHVSRSFAQRGHEVVGMGHGGWKSEEWQSWGLCRWTETDISIEALEKFGGEPEVIVHCAGGGSVPMSVVQPYQDFERTVISMANVLEYIRLKSPATRLVFPSSAAVYGNAETMPIKEEDRCAPISPYGMHKLLAEQLMTSYANAYGVSCVIVRFFSIYGCGLRKQLLWDACGKIAGGIIASAVREAKCVTGCISMTRPSCCVSLRRKHPRRVQSLTVAQVRASACASCLRMWRRA